MEESAIVLHQPPVPARVAAKLPAPVVYADALPVRTVKGRRGTPWLAFSAATFAAWVLFALSAKLGGVWSWQTGAAALALPVTVGVVALVVNLLVRAGGKP